MSFAEFIEMKIFEDAEFGKYDEDLQFQLFLDYCYDNRFQDSYFVADLCKAVI